MACPLSCLYCGKCCLADLTAYAPKEDFARWRAQGRQDILEIIERRQLIWAGDRMISAETGDYAQECFFLQRNDKKWFCSIYETRPLVCREYQPCSSPLCPQWRADPAEKL